MKVTFKGIEHLIVCDASMPHYVHDEDSVECMQCIPVCKSCILERLGAKNNEGWDDEDNLDYDMSINIAGESVTLF